MARAVWDSDCKGLCLVVTGPKTPGLEMGGGDEMKGDPCMLQEKK